MGIVLSGAIQVYCEARPQFSIRAFWDTVCMWEFNKDYPLMQELGEGNRRPGFASVRIEDDWPEESLYSDCLQVFTPQELPRNIDSHRYLALRAAVNSLSVHNDYSKIRILFWRN